MIKMKKRPLASGGNLVVYKTVVSKNRAQKARDLRLGLPAVESCGTEEEGAAFEGDTTGKLRASLSEAGLLASSCILTSSSPPFSDWLASTAVSVRAASMSA